MAKRQRAGPVRIAEAWKAEEMKGPKWSHAAPGTLARALTMSHQRRDSTSDFPRAAPPGETLSMQNTGQTDRQASTVRTNTAWPAGAPVAKNREGREDA